MSQKRVLITGSTKGLGYELANQFLQEGDRVCVTSRSEANVNDVVLELRARYGMENVCGIACDVCDHEQVSELSKYCAENFGGIDFFIKKYTGNQSLEKVDNNILPDYLIDNFKKYEEWFD